MKTTVGYTKEKINYYRNKKHYTPILDLEDKVHKMKFRKYAYKI